MISSKAINKLNTIRILYCDTKKGVGALFDDQDNPLYLIGEIPNINMELGINNLWGAGKNIFGTAAQVAASYLSMSGTLNDALGSLSRLSGGIDFQSKFLYEGSKAQEFTLSGILINRDGWNISIAPKLNELADWMLPSRQKDKDGKDLSLTKTAVDDLAKPVIGYLKDATSPDSITGSNIVSLLEKALEHAEQWIGDAYLLKFPKQMDVLNKTNMKVVIGEKGRFEIPNVYIAGASVRIPKAFMVNAQGEQEPDSVEITLNLKTLRQTTTSTLKF